MAEACVNGNEINKRLVEIGLIPHNTRRIVIDIQSGSCVMVYYETFADKETVDLVLEELIKHPKQLQVKPITVLVEEPNLECVPLDRSDDAVWLKQEGIHNV